MQLSELGRGKCADTNQHLELETRLLIGSDVCNTFGSKGCSCMHVGIKCARSTHCRLLALDHYLELSLLMLLLLSDLMSELMPDFDSYAHAIITLTYSFFTPPRKTHLSHILITSPLLVPYYGND